MIDSLLVGLCNWKTTLLGLLAAAAIYVSQIGGKMPATKQEWWAFSWAVIAIALGVVGKDATTGSRPPVILFALLGLGFALAGCATLPGNPAKMTAEQLKEVVKDKSATVSCATVQTPYKGNVIFLNLDKGVLAVGEVTVKSDCEITIKNAPPK